MIKQKSILERLNNYFTIRKLLWIMMILMIMVIISFLVYVYDWNVLFPSLT